MMSDITKDITAIIVSSIGIGSIITFLGKLVITKAFDRGIERYKNSLDKDLETHKSQLQQITLEHQVRYSKLHEERAVSIKEMFILLQDLRKKLGDYTSLFQGPEWTKDDTKQEAARDAHNALCSFFEVNRIYYTEDISTLIENIRDRSKKIFIDMMATRMDADFPSDGQTIDRKSVYQRWRDANDRVSSEIDNTRNALVKEFRKLLGVN